MLRKIRRNLFETNSSSVHSIVFENNTFKDISSEINSDLTLRFKEFGWGYDELHSVEEKLEYVLASIQYFDNKLRKAVENFYKEDNEDTKERMYTSFYSSKYYKWLRDMFNDKTGHFFYISGGEGVGYVDHDSVDTLEEYWSDNEKEFKKNMEYIIFNKYCYIVIDNDN